MTDSNEPLQRLSESTEPLEQQVNRYASNLKHIDELLERARNGAAGRAAHAGIQAQLEKAGNDRDRFSEHLDQLKQMPPDALSEELIEKSGPMGIWDAVAMELERLVERVERK